MLQICSIYHNTIIEYYHSILITWTEIQPLCTLRTPFDIVLNALLNYDDYHPTRPCKTHMFYKYAHISGPRGSPDMNLNAFLGKFHASKNGIRPRAWRHPNSNPKCRKIQNICIRKRRPRRLPVRSPEPGVWQAAARFTKLHDFLSGGCRLKNQSDREPKHSKSAQPRWPIQGIIRLIISVLI